MIGVVLPSVAIILTTVSFVTLAQVSNEVPIAKVTFEKDHMGFKKRWKLHYFDIATEGQLDEWIYGDNWRLDVAFLKMKPWANLFGVQPRFVIERIEGRYKSISEQNSEIRFAYDLKDDEDIYMPDRWFDYNFFVDVEYGSSVYTTIKTDTVFTVYRTAIGVLVREEQKQVKDKSQKEWWEIF